MSQPDQQALEPSRADAQTSPLLRAAIWVAIGALIAAALVCVVWVLIGEQNGIVGRAFLTILLLAGFAGVAILDAHLAPRRPAWFALASMATWIVTLLIGAVMIWMPERYSWSGFGRFLQFLFIVLILQLALLHVRLYMKALERYVTRFTQIVAFTTIGLVTLLAVLLIIPLMLSEWVDFADIYWRIVVATAILAAVGTALLPLVNALFAPRKARPVAAAPAPGYPGGPAYDAGFGASAGYAASAGYGASGGYGPTGGYGAPATHAAYPGAQSAPAAPPFSAHLPAAPEPYRGPAGATPIDPAAGTDAAAPAPQGEQPQPARSVVTHAAVQQAQAEAAQAAGEQPAPDAGPSPAAAPTAAPAASAEPELLPWPMFADGVTPLPMMPDGSPDFAAYQTGFPSPGAHVFAPVSPPPAQEAPEQPAPPAPGYDGFPPPPPLPPRG